MSEQWHYEQKGESYIKVDTLHKIRTLESELAAARKGIAKLKEQYTPWWARKRSEIDKLREVTEQRDGLRSGIDYASDQLTRVTEQLTAAREELADWHNAAQQVKAEYPDEVHCSCVAILRKQLKDVTEQRDSIDSMYHKVIKEVLECDPIPACQREDDQLEPPWEVIARVREQRDRLADLVKQFIYILDITEESDSGRLFHPTSITSCRAGDLQKAGELVEALRRASRNQPTQ